MPLPIFQIDAFADRPFTGNPAAVVFLYGERESPWMQSVAAEMNLAETAFVRQLNANRFELRWFTPLTEVDLCGHATLATAHALWEYGAVQNRSDVCFESRSGDLNVKSLGASIELNFPITPAEECVPPDGLLESLHVRGHAIPVTHVGRSKFDYLFELPESQHVHELQPNFQKLKQVDARGVIVTAHGTPESGFDFVSRFFAPAAGIDEDPVTGSAHCCLADYWGRRLGKVELVGYQASGRGGTVQMKVVKDRVLLRGQAVTIFHGTLEA
ncbi:MAG: PhzF family phenazine biosynthesis isomerase [Fuerstiella sp.]|nr:PhzF family phenazine biosynthesis isomerase [Fuerstiella sp.]